MSEFERILGEKWPELSSTARLRVIQFYHCVAQENQKQNLTRLISPTDFYEGHVQDVRELLKSGFLEHPVLDLGSGAGVPGLLTALIDEKPWILTDSEGSKARFLSESSQELGLRHVQVYAGRAEDLLKNERVGTVVARAVGPVERIFGWIGECSTWNRLVLLKGPGWDEEWKNFGLSKHRGKLKVVGIHEYSVGELNKQRKIIQLSRVPRGTKG